MAGNELATFVLNQVKGFESKLASSPDGEYLIPGISLADYGNAKLHVAVHLTDILARTYPEFQFWKSEKLFDNDGLTIHWRRLPQAVSPSKSRAQIEEEAFVQDLIDNPHWKPIVGFPGYWISNIGTVFSMKKRRLLKPVRRLTGRKMVRLYRDRKVVWRVIDKLKEAAFGPEEENR